MYFIKDQEGFTIIELITSFSLTMVVLIFLFNVVVIMKEMYMQNSSKSDLIINQSLLTTALSEDLYNKAIYFVKLKNCDSGYEYCYEVGLNSGAAKTLSISPDKIKYSNVVYSGNDFFVGAVNVCKGEYTGVSSSTNSYLQIKINVNSKIIENYNFGINVIHLYSANLLKTTLTGYDSIPPC